ncbi:MAG: CinA family protein [Clostridia bacterium]|nr:CinA family protein [Clostridia bacterium]
MIKCLKIFGYDEIEVKNMLQEIFSLFTTVEYKYRTAFSDTLLTVSGDVEVDIDNALVCVYDNFDSGVYADEDISLAERAVDFLKLYKYKLSVAESLTGGMICSAIVDVPGSSEVFYEGIIAYSNEAKKDRLEVYEHSLKEQGAVSSEVCSQMALGLLKDGNIDICVSTTGIAGPSGATEEKPIGLTYIAVADVDKCEVFKHIFHGDRECVRHTAANCALFHLINRLKQPTDFSKMVI